MRIGEPVVEIKAVLMAILFAASLAVGPGAARAESRFRMEKDAQGAVRPFKAVAVRLTDFVREYSRLTSTPITVGGSWERELKGTVTLFMRHPLKAQELTEVFYRVLSDNGYAVVDAPAGNGWVIQRSRDARDAAIPVYAADEVPDSSRVITAYRDLKHADAEEVSRMMRSFMPPASRIIPATRSKVFITDVASNIRRLNAVISRMDTPESAKRNRESMLPKGSPKSCGEKRIAKLVVEKLEIQESSGGGGGHAPPPPSAPSGVIPQNQKPKAPKEGGRK